MLVIDLDYAVMVVLALYMLYIIKKTYIDENE
jgi:hypothetical protein